MMTLHLGDCLNGCDTCKENYHEQFINSTCDACGEGVEVRGYEIEGADVFFCEDCSD